MSLAKLIFSASMANFFKLKQSLNSSSANIDHRLTIGDHRLTIGGKFVMSVIGRSTFSHLKFSQMSASRPCLTTENRPKVDWSIGRLILANRLTDDRPYSDYVKHLPSISGGQTDDVLLQICWSKKIKECPRGYR